MGFLVAALFGTVAAALTNYLLRDKLGPWRIVWSILLGMAAGLIVTVPITLAIYFFTRLDFSLYAIIGSILSPPATALAVWRYRPRTLPEGDMRR
jgi:hypothetical protein